MLGVFKGYMDVVISEKERTQIRNDFGRLLREKRLSRKISQEELAFISGLHRTYVGSVERGERNLSIENIYVFALALECDVKDLMPVFKKIKSKSYPVF